MKIIKIKKSKKIRFLQLFSNFFSSFFSFRKLHLTGNAVKNSQLFSQKIVNTYSRFFFCEIPTFSNFHFSNLFLDRCKQVLKVFEKCVWKVREKFENNFWEMNRDVWQLCWIHKYWIRSFFSDFIHRRSKFELKVFEKYV